MHALSKAIFFCTGAVGLLVLFLLGSILEFHTFSLEYFTESLVNFRFMDYTLAEMLWLGKPESLVDHLTTLKYGLLAYLGAFSIILMVISFLPSLGIQLKVLSFVISIPALALLLGFWVRFINDDNLVSRSEKTDLFIVTILAYPSSVFLLWYGLHVKRKKLPLGDDSQYVAFQASRVHSTNNLNYPLDKSGGEEEQTGSEKGETLPLADDESTAESVSSELIEEGAENMKQEVANSQELVNDRVENIKIEESGDNESEIEEISDKISNDEASKTSERDGANRANHDNFSTNHGDEVHPHQESQNIKAEVKSNDD